MCGICGFAPSLKKSRINFRSPGALIIRKWKEIYGDGFATRFVQRESGWRFYLRTSASSADSSSVRTGRINVSFAARPDHPQMDADLRRWLRDKVRSARGRGAAFICVHLRHLRIRPRYERVASMFVRRET